MSYRQKSYKLGYTYEEIITMMSQYELNLSYKEYEAMSEEEKGNYDELAKKFLFAVIPEDADLLYEYSVPIGYDMTMTYSASTKGTVPGDVVDTTLEYQKTQLQSISFNQGNTDLSLGEGSVGVGQKVDVGDDVQVGAGDKSREGKVVCQTMFPENRIRVYESMWDDIEE